jgi:hypothetical protein
MGQEKPPRKRKRQRRKRQRNGRKRGKRLRKERKKGRRRGKRRGRKRKSRRVGSSYDRQRAGTIFGRSDGRVAAVRVAQHARATGRSEGLSRNLAYHRRARLEAKIGETLDEVDRQIEELRAAKG